MYELYLGYNILDNTYIWYIESYDRVEKEYELSYNQGIKYDKFLKFCYYGYNIDEAWYFLEKII